METFFTEYEHTISAISTIATVAAVIVSLWVTAVGAKAHRTRITASCGIKLMVIQEIDKEEWPHYLMVLITNVGLMKAKVQDYSLLWTYPYSKQSLLIRPQDYYGDTYLQAVRYPILIEPNESHNIVMTKVADFEAMFEEKYIGRGFRKFFARFLTLSITTADGRVFKVKLNKQIRGIIKERTRMFEKKVK